MKRTMTSQSSSSSSSSSSSPSSPKKPKFIIPPQTHQPEPETQPTDPTTNNNFDKLDENLLYEVFRHADAKTLALSSCVNKQWHHTAQDERLWELICTRHWNNTVNCGTQQLRSVVLALGGFRRFHALYLSKASASAAATPVLPFQARVVRGAGGNRWGKDEVNLSLSLFSIRFYEKMNSATNSKRVRDSDEL